MKDTILNTGLIAATFAAILVIAFDTGRAPEQAVTVQASRVMTMEKTIIAAKRLPVEVASTTPEVTLVAANAR
jgi:hypothetical protein